MPNDGSDNPVWIKLRSDVAERARWQALAANKGVSLSELIRSKLYGSRLQPRREPPPVAPELLRELARVGNNLNQLAQAANQRDPITATALLTRLIEIDRELSYIRSAHDRDRQQGRDAYEGIRL